MSIREFNNKKGKTYEVRFTYKDRYGERKYYSKRGFTKLSEAKKHEKYMRVKVKDEDIKINKKTVDEVFDEYIEQSNLAITTRQMRRRYYSKHIQPYIGNMNIDVIDYPIIKKITDSTTCGGVAAILKGIFNLAYNNAYISRIPFSNLKIKKKRNTEKNKIITDEMLRELINYTSVHAKNSEAYILAYHIAWYTGMRLSEVLALEKSDIDFENDTISVNKTLYYNEEQKEWTVKSPKTGASVSIIPLALPLKKMLLEHFEKDPSNIIINKNGGYVPRLSIVETLKQYSKTHEHINFHMFRHTYTTKLFEAGVDPKTAQKLLRHKDFNTTLSIYTHIREESLNEAVNEVFN